MSAWTFDGNTLTDGVTCFDVTAPPCTEQYDEPLTRRCDAEGNPGAVVVGLSDVQSAAIAAYYAKHPKRCGQCAGCDERDDELRADAEHEVYLRREHGVGVR